MTDRLIFPQVKAHQIQPPYLTKGTRYNTTQWSDTDMVWSGTLSMTWAKSYRNIFLVDSDAELFAAAIIPLHGVDYSVLDSQERFVIQFKDGGLQKIYLGLEFSTSVDARKFYWTLLCLDVDVEREDVLADGFQEEIDVGGDANVENGDYDDVQDEMVDVDAVHNGGDDHVPNEDDMDANVENGDYDDVQDDPDEIVDVDAVHNVQIGRDLHTLTQGYKEYYKELADTVLKHPKFKEIEVENSLLKEKINKLERENKERVQVSKKNHCDDMIDLLTEASEAFDFLSKSVETGKRRSRDCIEFVQRASRDCVELMQRIERGCVKSLKNTEQEYELMEGACALYKTDISEKIEEWKTKRSRLAE